MNNSIFLIIKLVYIYIYIYPLLKFWKIQNVTKMKVKITPHPENVRKLWLKFLFLNYIMVKWSNSVVRQALVQISAQAIISWVNLHICIQASLVAQMVKNLPTVWKTWVWSLGQKDTLEKIMAIHSSILVWILEERSLVGYNPWSHKD